MDITQHNMTYV